MKTATHVIFDRAERRILTEAALGIQAAYRLEEDPHGDDERNPARQFRAIAQKGDRVSASRIHDARDTALQALDRLRLEADVNHWLDQLPVAERTAEGVISGRRMAEVLAESREIQARAVGAAVIVLDAARDLAADPADERLLGV